MAGQVWGVAADGGYMYSDELSDVLRMAVQPQIRYRQHCDAKDAMDKGYGMGSKFHWDVYSDVEQQGGTLNENDVMPETKFTITQGELTVTEYGQSVPFTAKLDNLSKHPVKEVIRKVMKNDASKAFDIAARAQFDATVLNVAPTSGTSTTAVTLETTGTCAITNNVAMGKDHIKAIVDIMKERDIPTFSAGDYYCIGRPTTFRTLKNDLETLHSYVDEGFRMIMNGEIGRYEGVRFIEQTNIASEGWTNAKSDKAHFFGEDTVAEAIVCPEEIRGKIPGDYGRSRGVAWYYMGGFGLVHGDAKNARIISWDSAA
jgi:N4-gp56 family major capsid protein